MLFRSPFDALPGDTPVPRALAGRWRVDSEYGRLTDVMLSAPHHLEMTPCNAVTRRSIEAGLACSKFAARRQHDELVQVLERAGVRCHIAPPRPDLPDATFTRDPAVMTPWGLAALNLAAGHRRNEPAHIAFVAASLGVPMMGSVAGGTIEGGDVCLLRPGEVVIGYSGERTSQAGATALGAMFTAHGWNAGLYPFDPQHLHFDTQFTLVARNEAVACVELLDARLLSMLAALGIELIPAEEGEVGRLGANLLCLGDRRIVAPADNVRLNRLLRDRGYEVIEVALDQFTRCGGGIHCLTLPLAREPG